MRVQWQVWCERSGVQYCHRRHDANRRVPGYTYVLLTLNNHFNREAQFISHRRYIIFGGLDGGLATWLSLLISKKRNRDRQRTVINILALS